MYMPLTYLNTKMVQPPVFTNITASGVQTTSLSSVTTRTAILSTNQIYFPNTGGNILNDTSVFGNLTVSGTISALSGLNVIATTVSTTTALSVANNGIGPVLFVNQQAAGTEKAVSINVSNIEVIRINNPSPANTNTGININYTGAGNILSVAKSTNPGQTAFTITSSGNVGINTPVADYNLHVNGDVVANTFTGSLTGNVQGNVTGNLNGNVTATTVTTNTVNSVTANITNLNINSLFVNQLTATNISSNVSVINQVFHYVFTNADNGKIFHFNTVSFPLTAFFPISLNDGFNVTLLNVSTNYLQISSHPTLNAIGNRIYDRFGGALVYKEGGQFFAIGRLAN